MNRCPTVPFSFLFAPLLASALLCGAVLPATAQVVAPLGGVRTFPENALRGTLAINSTVDAQLDGKAIRMAPGMRLLSPQNTLVMAHSVIGQKFTVNYVVEASTGMLLTAWILSKDEAAQPRKGATATDRNFIFESEIPKR
ncbi:hypothetical protein AVKW3434_07155 [Acidovorax sp. SUPP3434]|uniref:hypothetical protein n=1 Tax=Acidovorax sp. SUPP3434 TaxID=2920880 RepID=UPI0023DE3166|nr:hypothetical protein [Acidovorax sp. SUPP3434]GKS99141.1 hypothetical protein AVKW3434_07155 [Acidovorax sp. SUPP3434]